jgi:hypothetical protein
MGNTSRASSRGPSNHSRTSSRAPSNHSRAPSDLSKLSNHSRSTSSRSTAPGHQRDSSLVIEGPRRVSFDTSTSREWLTEEYELDSRSIESSRRNSYDPEAWPKGIIKTVSVEVVEEDNPDIPQGAKISTVSDINIEQDWETMLRTGPTHQ